jgi:hypothetical protein
MLFCWIYLQIRRRKISTIISSRSRCQIKYGLLQAWNQHQYVRWSIPPCIQTELSRGKVNKCEDVCLLNLLKFACDQCFGRMIQLTKGRVSYQVKTIQERHRRSLGLPLAKVVHANTWNMESSNGNNIYKVQCLQDKCPETKCHLSCIECGICNHCFVCTCPDLLILHTICKHIHLVQQALSFAKDNSIDCEDCDCRL